MRTILLILALNLLGVQIYAQDESGIVGTEISIDISKFLAAQKGLVSKANIDFTIPMPNGVSEIAELNFTPVAETQPSSILTYSGKTQTTHSAIKITHSDFGFSAIFHFEGRYHFIEQDKKNKEVFRMYSLSDLPKGVCEVNEEFKISEQSLKTTAKSIAPFPVGSTLRKYRMAGAATGEMTSLYSSQSAASAQIVSIINAANLIYELEAAVTFELIAKSTTSPYQIIFTNSGSDPFTPQGGASAFHSQQGFNTMNGNGTLLYSEYDIGHTFHSTASGGNGFSASGQAGPDPCDNSSKARAWSQFTVGAPIGFITSLVVHEMGHQFSAWHTFNGNSGLCVSQWSSTAAVEPGSGSTLMAYGDNCSQAPNYVLTEPNEEDYFHTKSLEQIYNTVAGDGSCITTSNTGNFPPVADAGSDLTIPKGTPFKLTGVASDPDGSESLTYVWDQFDVATSNDKGALGSNISGDGGYSAVNSTANAPLFRSKMSNSPIRYFPDLNFVLNNANNPNDNEGEDLPQVGRGMTFRLTVRDNEAGGGGVDSDEMEITVDGTKGPFEISSQNASAFVNAGENLALTWNVNNTNTISSNVKITMSSDGGATFSTTLMASTPNDGAESITIPGNIAANSKVRLKVSSTHDANHEFFDINNADLTVLPAGVTCTDYSSSDVPKTITNGSPATSTLTINDNVTITDVDVIDLEGSHSYVGDMVITLQHPDNSAAITLINSNGSWGCDNFNLNLDDEASSGLTACSDYQGGTYQPVGSLSAFDGKASNGTWDLRITDVFSDDDGMLTGWTLRVCSMASCDISSLSASSPVCSGNNATFNMNFTATNGSGNYQVVNSSNTVVGSGSSSPIAVTVIGPTASGDQNFRVRDANDFSCISSALSVAIPQCPPCDISGLSAGTVTCSGNDAVFNMSFTVANGSGNYEVVNSSNTVVGAGNNSPISVTISGPTTSGSQNFRVRDANNISCISSSISVNLPQCPPPCSITNVSADASATCNGQDAIFNVTSFTVSNGSGSYQVVDASDQVIGNSTMAPIAALVTGPTSAGNQNFRVRDVNNISCISSPVSVSIPTCLLPCNAASPATVSGTISSDTLRTKTYLTSTADVTSGNVKFQARDSVILSNSFEVNTTGVFEVQIGDCDDSP